MEKKINDRIVVYSLGLGVILLSVMFIFAEKTPDHMWIWTFLLSFILIGMNVVRYLYNLNLSILTSLVGIWTFGISINFAFEINTPGVVIGILLLPLGVMILATPDKWLKIASKKNKE